MAHCNHCAVVSDLSGDVGLECGMKRGIWCPFSNFNSKKCLSPVADYKQHRGLAGRPFVARCKMNIGVSDDH
jgi:hypothetical protein